MKKNHEDIDEDQEIHLRHVKKMKEYYAKTVENYNTWHCNLGNRSSHNYAVKELIHLVSRTKSQNVLDVCCGTGRAIKGILELGIEAHGIDLSPELVEVGINELGIPRSNFTVGDATALPFEDNQFDISCVMGALHHSALPLTIISEMLRISKHGIVISDQGNGITGGIKSILIKLGIFDSVYKIIFKREPRQHRTQLVSDGDGPTFMFSVDEILPQIKKSFPKIKILKFYGYGRFQTCSYWYPRIFARQAVVVASK